MARDSKRATKREGAGTRGLSARRQTRPRWRGINLPHQPNLKGGIRPMAKKAKKAAKKAKKAKKR